MRSGIQYPVFYCIYLKPFTEEGIGLNPIVSLPEPLNLGLHAIVILAQDPGRCLTTHQIATTLCTPEPHLSKVLQRLNKGGLIRSIRGPGGGYKLDCDPKTTRLFQIFELLGGPFVPRGCSLQGCKKHVCFIGGMMDELTFAFLKYLKSRYLSDLTHYYTGSIPVAIDINVKTPVDGKWLHTNGK